MLSLTMVKAIEKHSEVSLIPRPHSLGLGTRLWGLGTRLWDLGMRPWGLGTRP